MLTTMFTVLSVAFKAFVALSAVGGVTVAFEVVALAVGAGQGDALNDGHESILTKPTTHDSSVNAVGALHQVVLENMLGRHILVRPDVLWVRVLPDFVAPSFMLMRCCPWFN